MSQDNYAILTTIGRLRQAQRAAGQAVAAISHMAFGDADRSPTGGETALGHEVHRAALTGWGIEPGQTAAFFDCYVPAAIGGFVVREFGLYDAAGDMVAIGRRSPGIPKTAPENGGGDDLTFRMDVFFDQLNTLVVTVSPIAGITADNLDLYLHPNNLPLNAAPLTAAPASPPDKGQWLVAPNPIGTWAGRAGQIARFRGGVWRYEVPLAGRVVSYWSGTRLVHLRFDGAAWAEWLASETAAGPVELATAAETRAGTDATLAVTPAGLAAALGGGATAAAANLRQEKLSSSGNWPVPANVTAVIVELSGGAGSGGSSNADGNPGSATTLSLNGGAVILTAQGGLAGLGTVGSGAGGSKNGGAIATGSGAGALIIPGGGVPGGLPGFTRAGSGTNAGSIFNGSNGGNAGKVIKRVAVLPGDVLNFVIGAGGAAKSQTISSGETSVSAAGPDGYALITY